MAACNYSRFIAEMNFSRKINGKDGSKNLTFHITGNIFISKDC